MKNYRLQNGCWNCVNSTTATYPFPQIECELEYSCENGIERVAIVHECGICDLHEIEQEEQ